MAHSPNTGDNRSGVITSVAQLDRLRAMMLAQPIPAKTRFIPWGYEVDPKNPKMYLPIDSHFALLWEAKTRFLKECSYVEVAAWLSAKTGSKISDEGLTRIINRRPPVKECLLPLEERMKL